MLEVKDLTVAYGDHIALDGVSLKVAQSEIVALCGPNGAGKSSLIGALAGDIKPATGKAMIGGEDPRAIAPARLARLRAVMEQTPSVSAPFTVVAMVGLAIPRELPPDAAKLAVAEALSDVALSDRAETRVHDLSGGQQRRAHLARAIAQLQAGRSLGGGLALILDEPTAGLDVSHQIAALEAAQAAAGRGAAVIVALHDLSLAAAYADRIALLKQGRLIIDAEPESALEETALSDIFDADMTVFPAPNGALCVMPALPSSP
ncbi:MAG: ATP-binding cassette domain-containing protein [Pseudomonadota bacterium]